METPQSPAVMDSCGVCFAVPAGSTSRYCAFPLLAAISAVDVSGKPQQRYDWPAHNVLYAYGARREMDYRASSHLRYSRIWSNYLSILCSRPFSHRCICLHRYSGADDCYLLWNRLCVDEKTSERFQWNFCNCSGLHRPLPGCSSYGLQSFQGHFLFVDIPALACLLS